MHVLLRDLQDRLTRLYDLDLRQDICDYLVTDPDLLRVFAGGNSAAGRDVEEKLIVMESDGVVDLALYLDADVLGRLMAADPREELSGRNLADFWTVLEGVSHFNYVTWNATLDKPVTLLELEMQAEVDKYVSTRLLLEQQPAARLGGPLMARLFEEPGYDPQLGCEELGRYHDASHLAGRYCASLQSRFPGNGFAPDMLRELRTFYRLPQIAKVSRIRASSLN